MKTFILLVLVALAAADPLYNRENRRESERRYKPEQRQQQLKYQSPTPEQLKPRGEKYVRVCVSNSCEMKKCQRMTSELTYNVKPSVTVPKEWSCIKATCKEQCLQWVKQGYADVVVARDEDVHKAIRKYKLEPIAYEIPQIDDSLKREDSYETLKKYEKISLAVIKKSNSEIHSVRDLEGVPSCHAGVEHPASFKAPVCSLIEKKVIPVTGDHKESAADFFKKSCVPGILDPRVDRNGTNPVQLVEICGSQDEKKGTKEDVFHGYEGSIKCLKEGKGQVAFIDQNHIPHLERENEEFMLVCKDQIRELRNWKKVECHHGYSPRPTILTRKDKFAKKDLFEQVRKEHGYETPEDRTETEQDKQEQKEKDKQYNKDVAETLVQAVTYSSQEKNAFKLFSSEEYKCDDLKIKKEKKLQVLKKLEEILGVKITQEIKDEEKKQEEEVKEIERKSFLKSEEEKKEEEHKKDLIFRDNTIEIVDISSKYEEEKKEDEKYAKEFMKSSDKCAELQGKPRAKFCVTTEKEYEKCLKMKEYFSKTDEVKDVTFGCERAHSKLECMKKVYEGQADLVSLKPEEAFIAGRELLLQPIMSEFHEVFEHEIENGKKHYDDETKTTKTYTVGIIKKDKYTKLFSQEKPINGKKDWENKSIDLKKVKTCMAGVSKLSGFKHPIGHLMANGTIPRIGSIFESIQKHFERTCLPGAKHFTVEKDLILGHEFNWGHNTTKFANFTGRDFYVWNSPYTWTYYDLQKKTPQIAETILRLPELLKSLEEKDLPEELKQKVKDVRSREDERFDRFNRDSRRHQKKEVKEEEKDEEIKRLFEQLKRVEESKYLDEYEKVEQIRRIKKQILKRKQEKSQQQWYESLLGDKPEDHEELEKLLKELDLPALQHVKAVLDTAIPEHLRKAVPEIHSLLKVIPSMQLDQTDKTYLSHPTVQRFLQVYYPALAKQLLKVVGDEFKHDKHNRYTSPIWLSPEYKEFLDKMRLHGEKLSESCEGTGEENKHTESFTDTIGALKCLEGNKGDVTFLPSHKLEEITRHFPDLNRQPQDYALICPNGTVIPYVDTKSIKKCNLGKVPFNAIMTDSRKCGTYRWNVTKALLHAQKKFEHHNSNEFSFKMFGEDSVFDKETSKLYPVPLVNQTFEVHLGPQLLRSLEALVKPSSTHIFKQHKQLCYGQQFSNVIYQHNETCRAVVKTVTCSGEPRNKTIHLNKHGEKVSVQVEMISRPSRYSRKLVEFTCDTGYSYLKPVVIPEDCECVPKDEIVVTPKWNHDKIWYSEERKYHLSSNPLHQEDEKLEKKLWGNKKQWADRKDVPNFFKEPETREKYLVEHPKEERVVKYNRLEFDSKKYWKKTEEICEKRHEGKEFEKEKKDLTRPVCPKEFKKTQYKQLPVEQQKIEKKLNEQIYTEKVEEHKYKIVDSRKSKRGEMEERKPKKEERVWRL